MYLDIETEKQAGRQEKHDTHTDTINPFITVIISSILGEMNTTFYMSFTELSTRTNLFLSAC